MTATASPTLGTLLRYLIENLDGAVEDRYVDEGLDFRPRYTPVLRALLDLRAASIRSIARHATLTHSAASQTIAQMIKSGLLKSQPGEDARERVVSLTPRAMKMLPKLQQLWATTNIAARELDRELSMPLSALAQEAIAALERRSFGERMQRARKKTRALA